ncbi:MAG: CARDB domain-containing protein [Acidimicrobiia bacterium]
MLLVSIMVVGTFAVSYAGTTTAATNNKICGARVALVLDRSSSIGVDRFSGSRAQSVANINAIKSGANSFVDALIGKDSYTDVYTFASVAERVNTGGWFNVKDQTAANWQKLGIGGLKFKQGADSSSENAYWDGLPAGNEGLTNWEGALNLVGSTRQDPFPTHLVIFTDGNPTTNQIDVKNAIANGSKLLDETQPQDINPAINSAKFLRGIGIKVIPIAVGSEANVNMANLQAIAGAGNPVYRSASYSGLTASFQQAASNICQPPVTTTRPPVVTTRPPVVTTRPPVVTTRPPVVTTRPPVVTTRPPVVTTRPPVVTTRPPVTVPGHPTTLSVKTVDESGKLVASTVKAYSVRTIGGPSSHGEAKTTSVDANNQWSAKWTFKTSEEWRVRIAQNPVPTGYVAVRDLCVRETFDSWPLPQREGTDKSPSMILLDPVQNIGGNIYCVFTVRKVTTPVDKIELTKTVNPTSAKPGQEVVYSFVVKNTGNSVLKNVKITDPMLGGQVGATIASLAPGASSAVVTKKYTIPANATGTIHNVATATGTPTDPDGKTRPNVKDDDPADLTVLVSSWTATKTANKQTVVAGDTVTYTITVKNTGNTTLTNVEVSDPTINFAKVVIPEIKAGEFKSVTATYVIPKGFTGKEFKNVALVCVPSGTQTPDCKKPEALVKVINISIVKSADKETATPGDKVIYTFVVTNTGGADIDPTPINDNVLGVVGDPGVLEPGKSATFTKEYIVPGTAKAGDKIINIATVCASTDTKAQSVPTDCVSTCPASSLTTVCDQDTHTLTITIPKITIDKTADKESAAPGDSVIYTFVVTNTSDVDVFNVTVTDNILGDLGTIDKLAAGASYTKTVTYVVPVDAAGTIRNVATACFETPVVTDHCVSDDHVLAVVAVLGENVTRVSPSSSLAYTGASSSWMVLVGLLMLGAGVAIYFLTRKRRTI